MQQFEFKSYSCVLEESLEKPLGEFLKQYLHIWNLEYQSHADAVYKKRAFKKNPRKDFWKNPKRNFWWNLRKIKKKYLILSYETSAEISEGNFGGNLEGFAKKLLDTIPKESLEDC